jgi:hypothetical protein
LERNKKVAFYCSGNFSELLFHLSGDVEGITPIYYLQNFKGLKFFKINNNCQIYRYQFEKFNTLIKKKIPESVINYNEVYQADKSHFKKFSGKYVKTVISTFAYIFKDWIQTDKPDFVFFPIIESLDAMTLYLVCKELNIQTIVYTHSRLTHLSLLSPDKYESYPKILDEDWSKIFLLSNNSDVLSIAKNLMSSHKRLNNQADLSIKFLNEENTDALFQPKIPNAASRFLNNILHKFGSERHNKFINNNTKIRVALHRVFIPLGNFIYNLIEKLYLNPKRVDSLPDKYNFFPLQFSPESSINTPAPYYIDQIRAIDKILLSSHLPLVICEHPAVYGKRPFSFYRAIKKRPNLYFSSHNDDYNKIMSRAEKVYSVTGTVSLECFMKNKPYALFGKNLLTSFLEHFSKVLSHVRIDSRLLFVASLFHFGKLFLILPHQGKIGPRDLALFSKANKDNFASALYDFIKRH